MILRRRVGVVGAVARTAVVAGTATAVSRSVSNRMAPTPQASQVQYEQPQAVSQAPDLSAQLQNLSELKAQGALSEEEFIAAKRKLMES